MIDKIIKLREIKEFINNTLIKTNKNHDSEIQIYENVNSTLHHTFFICIPYKEYLLNISNKITISNNNLSENKKLDYLKLLLNLDIDLLEINKDFGYLYICCHFFKKTIKNSLYLKILILTTLISFYNKSEIQHFYKKNLKLSTQDFKILHIFIEHYKCWKLILMYIYNIMEILNFPFTPIHPRHFYLPHLAFKIYMEINLKYQCNFFSFLLIFSN